jgi:hypothetical protein
MCEVPAFVHLPILVLRSTIIDRHCLLQWSAQAPAGITKYVCLGPVVCRYARVQLVMPADRGHHPAHPSIHLHAVACSQPRTPDAAGSACYASAGGGGGGAFVGGQDRRRHAPALGAAVFSSPTAQKKKRSPTPAVQRRGAPAGNKSDAYGYSAVLAVDVWYIRIYVCMCALQLHVRLHSIYVQLTPDSPDTRRRRRCACVMDMDGWGRPPVSAIQRVPHRETCTASSRATQAACQAGNLSRPCVLDCSCLELQLLAQRFALLLCLASGYDGRYGRAQFPSSTATTFFFRLWDSPVRD